MGKGNRVRVERADERKAKKEAEARAQSRSRLTHSIFVCICVVLVAALVCGIVYAAFLKNAIASSKLHKSVAVESEHYQVDGAQMSYYFNSTYVSILNQYSSYLSYFGLDTKKDLHDQECAFEQGKSWYDYIAEQSSETAKQMLVLCEEGEKRGISLEDSDYESIDAAVAALREQASAEKLSMDKFITKYYGKNVKENDLREALKIRQLASKVYNVVYDEPSFTDDQIVKQCADNIASYYKTDYKTFEFAADVKKDATDEELAAANAASKAEADKLAAAEDADEFDKLLEEYYLANNTMVDEDDPNAVGEGYITEGQLKTNINNATKIGAAYSETGDYAEWAFEKDDNGEYVRKVGDSTVTESKDKDTGVITYTVYYMLKTYYRDDYTTKTVRHILVSVDSYDRDNGLPDADAKAKADEILAKYNEGDKTEDAFAALADEYTSDAGSKGKGGLYDNALKGETVTEFNDWIYDENRKAGEVEIIKTQFGYHVMYFVGDGEEAWKVSAEGDLRSSTYSKAYEEMEKTYSVTINKDALNSVSVCTLA